MVSTTIYLIRHGDVDNPKKVFYGRTIKVELTDKGREQIRNLAEKLLAKGEHIVCIYTSPMKRALESATVFSKAYNDLPIVQEESFTEVDIPALVGKPNSLRGKMHSEGKDEYTGEFVKQGSESAAHITERMINAFRRIVTSHKGEVVVIVSHGDPIRYLTFRVKNSSARIPLMGDLVKSDYTRKGEGWKIKVNSDGIIEEFKRI